MFLHRRCPYSKENLNKLKIVYLNHKNGLDKLDYKWVEFYKRTTMSWEPVPHISEDCSNWFDPKNRNSRLKFRIKVGSTCSCHELTRDNEWKVYKY